MERAHDERSVDGDDPGLVQEDIEFELQSSGREACAGYLVVGGAFAALTEMRERIGGGRPLPGR